MRKERLARLGLGEGDEEHGADGHDANLDSSSRYGLNGLNKVNPADPNGFEKSKTRNALSNDSS